jgi:hypothetical protein
MTISTRGRCSGSDPRSARRFFRSGLAQRRVGLLLLGLGRGNRLLEILQRQVQLVGIELFRAAAEPQPLQLADQMAQAVVLVGEPLVLGALGIALGPRRQHQRAQRRDILGQGLHVGHGRIIAPGQPRRAFQPEGESKGRRS